MNMLNTKTLKRKILKTKTFKTDIENKDVEYEALKMNMLKTKILKMKMLKMNTLKRKLLKMNTLKMRTLLVLINLNTDPIASIDIWSCFETNPILFCSYNYAVKILKIFTKPPLKFGPQSLRLVVCSQ